MEKGLSAAEVVQLVADRCRGNVMRLRSRRPDDIRGSEETGGEDENVAAAAMKKWTAQFLSRYDGEEDKQTRFALRTYREGDWVLRKRNRSCKLSESIMKRRGVDPRVWEWIPLVVRSRDALHVESTRSYKGRAGTSERGTAGGGGEEGDDEEGEEGVGWEKTAAAGQQRRRDWHEILAVPFIFVRGQYDP
eukprot:GHVU01010780.1.p6 GENE.GHVU01010780.1~~GHVU01010780.1.p6  ORF type:complete len:191 (+),score=36.90 GHVU01010780.1:4110-4682(+)